MRAPWVLTLLFIAMCVIGIGMIGNADVNSCVNRGHSYEYCLNTMNP